MWVKATEKKRRGGREMFRKLLNRGWRGQRRGVLRGVEKTDVERGRAGQDGDDQADTKFKGEVHPVEEEGGRHTRLQGYRPQLYIGRRRTGVAELPEASRW